MKQSLAWMLVVLLAASLTSFGGRPRSAAAQETDVDVSTEEIDETATASEEETLEHVPTIVKIDYAIQESEPPNLLITAYGKVPTGGWKQVQLLRRVYVKPPSDGIWEYDLLAKRPTGPVIQVETLVKASNRWKAFDKSIKGVRVYGVDRGVKEIKIKL